MEMNHNDATRPQKAVSLCTNVQADKLSRHHQRTKTQATAAKLWL